MRGGQDCGGAGLYVLELRPVGRADIALVRRHPAGIVRMPLHQVSVQVGQCTAHFQGVFLIDTKNDGLGEAVGVFEKIGQMAGDGLGTLAQGDDALEVLGGIFPVGNRPAIAVQLARTRTPADRVVVGNDPVHPVGREKAVGNALGQAVFVDGSPEILIGVAVVLTQWGGGHAELDGWREPFQDAAPVAVVARTAPMTFVHNHQVEEVSWILTVQAGPVLVTGHGLVKREVDVAALDGLALSNFMPCVAERPEVLCHGIVHQNVAVGQKQDFRLAGGLLGVPACGPQLPADLEGNRRLAGPGAEGQQAALLALQDGLYGSVQRDFLIVAQRLRSVRVAGLEQLTDDGRIPEMLGITQTLPELVRFGKGGALAFHAGGVVELDDLGAVGGVGEFEAENLGVVLGLLQTLSGVFVARLGFDHRNGKVGPVA